MKKYLCMVILALCLTGCSAVAPEEEVEEENVTVTVKGEETEKPLEEKASFSFAELKNIEFNFSSGAGAWGTVLRIEEDGSFSGEFSDADMGSGAAEYPNGTYYQCVFKGTFTEPVKVNEYTYSMQIRELSLENEIGDEEVKNQIHYIYSGPYGLENAEEILIYLPGTPVELLPEEYVSWVQYFISMDGDGTNLPFYGLYNEAEQNGFYGRDIVESLYEMLDATEEHAASVEASIMNDDLNQAELNEQSFLLYQLWDSVLNQVWGVLRDTMNEENFDGLLQEQRSWIAEKEQKISDAAASVDGGSMAGMLANQRAAELTKVRVYELMEYFTYNSNAQEKVSYSGLYVNKQRTDDIYSQLSLSYQGEDAYNAEITIYRLAALEGTAVLKGDALIFEDEEMQVKGEIEFRDSTAVLTIIESGFEHMKAGDCYEFLEKVY